MTKRASEFSLDPEPWRGLPAPVADLIEPELATIAAEILATIGREVPEYARPLEGRFGRGLRTGVEEALRQFVALIRDPDAGRGPGREVYVQLGRGEQRQGRTLDSLQAAYRIGARVAWRRIGAAGRRAGLPAESLTLLAEAIFAYIDELSADSVDGYAQAQAEVEDVRRRRRHELAALLVGEPPAERADVSAAARAAGWRLPRRLAALACEEAVLGRVARRLPPDSLATEIDAAGLLRADEHLADLLLFEGRPLLERIAARRLAPLAGLTEKTAARMRETALAHLRHGGNAVAMAAAMHVHPQTARYRVARLRELLGEQLDDPDARFELELALRASA